MLNTKKNNVNINVPKTILVDNSNNSQQNNDPLAKKRKQNEILQEDVQENINKKQKFDEQQQDNSKKQQVEIQPQTKFTIKRTEEFKACFIGIIKQCFSDNDLPVDGVEEIHNGIINQINTAIKTNELFNSFVFSLQKNSANNSYKKYGLDVCLLVYYLMYTKLCTRKAITNSLKGVLGDGKDVNHADVIRKYMNSKLPPPLQISKKSHKLPKEPSNELMMASFKDIFSPLSNLTDKEFQKKVSEYYNSNKKTVKELDEKIDKFAGNCPWKETNSSLSEKDRFKLYLLIEQGFGNGTSKKNIAKIAQCCPQHLCNTNNSPYSHVRDFFKQNAMLEKLENFKKETASLLTKYNLLASLWNSKNNLQNNDEDKTTTMQLITLGISGEQQIVLNMKKSSADINVPKTISVDNSNNSQQNNDPLAKKRKQNEILQEDVQENINKKQKFDEQQQDNSKKQQVEIQPQTKFTIKRTEKFKACFIGIIKQCFSDNDLPVDGVEKIHNDIINNINTEIKTNELFKSFVSCLQTNKNKNHGLTSYEKYGLDVCLLVYYLMNAQLCALEAIASSLKGVLGGNKDIKHDNIIRNYMNSKLPPPLRISKKSHKLPKELSDELMMASFNNIFSPLSNLKNIKHIKPRKVGKKGKTDKEFQKKVSKHYNSNLVHKLPPDQQLKNQIENKPSNDDFVDSFLSFKENITPSTEVISTNNSKQQNDSSQQQSKEENSNTSSLSNFSFFSQSNPPSPQNYTDNNSVGLFNTVFNQSDQNENDECFDPTGLNELLN